MLPFPIDENRVPGERLVMFGILRIYMIFFRNKVKNIFKPTGIIIHYLLFYYYHHLKKLTFSESAI
jgi:hypothetical protein